MKKSSNKVLDETSLYRYALWADMLRVKFEASLESNQQVFHTNQIVFDRKLLETEMFMFLWLGVLSTVIEGWPRLKMDNPQITTLLRNPYKNLLRDFRNATFHPEDFNDGRIKTLVNTGQKSVDWARKLTLEFVSFFESELFSKNKTS